MEGKALKEIESTINACTSLGELEKQRVALFGKKGHFAAQFEELKKLDGEEKKAFAQNLNTNKEKFLELLNAKKTLLEAIMVEEEMKKRKIEIKKVEKQINPIASKFLNKVA